MFLKTCMMIFVLCPSWIAAEDTLDKNPIVTEQIFTIVALIFATFLVTLGLVCFAYVLVTFIRRKVSEPQYMIDDNPNNEYSDEFPHGNSSGIVQIPHINQIKPVYNVRYMFSSVKQSMSDLGTSLVPFTWSRAQHMYNQSSSTNEKKDFPV
ncbi:hypothetical protein I4U23_028483 [Adineta vaga]|nr:hypothetical protein I4U23_028483 [Adineta vaga]